MGQLVYLTNDMNNNFEKNATLFNQILVTATQGFQHCCSSCKFLISLVPKMSHLLCYPDQSHCFHCLFYCLLLEHPTNGRRFYKSCNITQGFASTLEAALPTQGSPQLELLCNFAVKIVSPAYPSKETELQPRQVPSAQSHILDCLFAFFELKKAKVVFS